MAVGGILVVIIVLGVGVTLAARAVRVTRAP